ncbi:helix-turn-helix domain-containing protein [Streptomyces sp. URMC 124]|uniref:helix-turn-helix domain-containing protein n=1 Tax=Streptomyces sp. URMC 124 TaxID=3423405 RepID=UPI003F1BBCD7
MTPHSEPSRAEKFANVVRTAAERAGYVGRGAVARLARDSGLPETTISRMLSGERIPDPRSFEALAAALRIPIGELLVGAEIVSASTLHQIATPRVRSQPITIDEAADELGIKDALDRELFAGMVERLRRRTAQASRDAGSAGDEGGAAAER